MVFEYKKRGGGYNTDWHDQDAWQKHLAEWTEEKRQKKGGSANAKQANGTKRRYLPSQAWEDMTDQELKEKDERKLKENRSRDQFV